MEPIGRYDNEELYLKISNYRNNKRIYIGLETKEEIYIDITINLPNLIISGKDCVFLNSEICQDLRDFIEDKGIIKKSLGMYQYNMGIYEMVQVDFDKLKELNPKGFKEYEK